MLDPVLTVSVGRLQWPPGFGGAHNPESPAGSERRRRSSPSRGRCSSVQETALSYHVRAWSLAPERPRAEARKNQVLASPPELSSIDLLSGSTAASARPAGYRPTPRVLQARASCDAGLQPLRPSRLAELGRGAARRGRRPGAGPDPFGTGQARHHRLGQTGEMRRQGRLGGSSPGHATAIGTEDFYW